MTSSPLGRGLGSLISNRQVPPISYSPGTTNVPPAHEGVHTIPLADVRTNPNQPRSSIAQEGLAELIASVKAHGILQPLVVMRKNGGYEIIAGERRYQAAKAAGLTTLPVMIRDVNKQQQLELALVENLQREDLNPLEEAEAYQRLVDEFNATQEQVAKQVGKSRSYVANSLRLRNLPESAKQAILQGALSAGHAKLLLSVDDPAEQRRLLEEMLQKQLSVRASEALVRIRHSSKKAKRHATGDPDLRANELALQQALGTKVAIHKNKDGGSITITYYSREELNALIQQLTSTDRHG